MRQRSTRVWVLSLAIALMNIADLYLTLVYVKPGYMIEGNPLAAWIMSFSPFALAAWKLLCIGAACFILIANRYCPCGEIGCWAGFTVMLVLMGHWTHILLSVH